MAKPKGKRAHFPDEEPELETINYYYGPNKACTWCGNTGHDQKECYERPLSDWVQV